jgi:sugar/nucleoside kinase (ribokinase family)
LTCVQEGALKAAVFGNVTLDVICKTIDDVPRHASLSFEQVKVAPGGCASNVALGLADLGVETALIAHSGDDDAAFLIHRYWQRAGIDLRYVQRIAGKPTGTSVGLVDSDAQPRFIHTSGANATLTVDDLQPAELTQWGASVLHVAGFFVLPGLLDGRLPGALAQARRLGLFTSLDVVRSPRMQQPEALWPCLPHLDLFLCNAVEAQIITGREQPEDAAACLRSLGSRAVVVKAGERGCWLDCDASLDGAARREWLPAQPVDNVVDTTGAGDAFAAGLLASWLAEPDLRAACQAGHRAAARIVQQLGAVLS